MRISKRNGYFGVVIILLLLGLIARLWNINFGLPHSWYADEPEIGEPAIKYTYEIKNILRNNDVYKLIPENYVYGTFPVYFYTILVMIYSKTLGILGIGFSKADLYVFMRLINAVISISLIPVFYLMVRKLGLINRKFVSLVGIFLMVFNWKLIVHAHYLNHDIVITLLVLLANYFYYRYLQIRHQTNIPENDTLNTVLFALFFGLAVSTKITVLLTFPLYLYFFVINKDYRNLFASVFIIIGAFILTNPFAWLFIGDFFRRILEMQTVEGGMVFDSVDYSPFKYLKALSWILTLPVFLTAVLGLLVSLKEKVKPTKQFYLLIGAQVLFYLIFFTFQSRRVDRWMLPIVPNLMLFALVALSYLMSVAVNHARKVLGAVFMLVLCGYYLYFPALLLRQFQRNTPKSAAYIWAQENFPPTSTKFGLTEEGQDPLNKLPFSTIWQYNAYESKGAEFMLPPDPTWFDYVIISSRPMSWTKSTEVVKKYPYYAIKWQKFDETLHDSCRFTLIKRFELPKPNLIPLSDVDIYKRVI